MVVYSSVPGQSNSIVVSKVKEKTKDYAVVILRAQCAYWPHVTRGAGDRHTWLLTRETLGHVASVCHCYSPPRNVFSYLTR